MIEVEKGLQTGDIVYAWYSYRMESDPKRRKESEYRLLESSDERLKLGSDDGNYSIIFNKELIKSWYGGVRKATVRKK